ncbi:hypothetical protein [Streptomyces griseoflavus]|uniref:Uncharacterized protein n=1 Tax=Streptomyces griseoflavus Tu4000 TaxID=467200 RepID=D9XNE9_9ACTN|nr:hypothetical protein [Streptomyces griseoflavus]EFL38102.1 conserved hypothetical protein [Streptomyces griseoflavus Tu4000]
MSTPIHQVPARHSSATVRAARQRGAGARTRGPSGNSARHPLLAIQSSAGNRATTVAVQRARDTGQDKGRAPEGAGTPTAAKKKESLRDRITAVLDRSKKSLDNVDTFVKGVQTPTNAALTQQAAATVNDGLKASAAASDTSAGATNLVTESLGATVSALDAYTSRNDAMKHKTGANHHTANKKFETKATDAAVGTVSSGSYAAAIGKEATKVQHAANAAVASETSGALSSITGGVKSARAGLRVVKAARKYRNIKALGDPEQVHAASLARLANRHMQDVATAVQAIEMKDAVEERDGSAPAVEEANAIAEEATEIAENSSRRLVRAYADLEKLKAAQEYAKKKQLTKIGKETTGGVVGESSKAAAGIVTAVAATAGGAGLASNPVGWALAATGAGLVLGVTAYKAGRAGMKRYEEARRPERWAPEAETPAQGASRRDSLKHALKFSGRR